MPTTTTRDGVRLAYEHRAGATPGVIFLGGLASDMTGTKATALEAWAARAGRAFLRLDYRGHGASEGTFEAGTIGEWRDDALHVIAEAMPGAHVVVGSSMGGWLACLIARDHPDRVAGLVTVAAAPDFTEDGYWATFTEAQRLELFERGRLMVPSDYGPPQPVTRRLIEDGRDHLVLRGPLPIGAPVRMLQGTADADVPPDWATRLLAHMDAADAQLLMVKGADHRFSGPREVELLEAAVTDVLARLPA